MHFNYILKKKFLIILPPPNITGELHIGHFYQYFIIDIIIKWKKIQGFKIFYLFGFDHAGISAIIKFKNKKKIFYFLKEYKKKIFFYFYYINFYINIKNIKFTLSIEYKKLVKKIFVKLFKKSIIYKKKTILNYDVKSKKNISDIEIENNIFIKSVFYIKCNNKKVFLIENKEFLFLIFNLLKKNILNTFNYKNFNFLKKKKYYNIIYPLNANKAKKFNIKSNIFFVKKNINNKLHKVRKFFYKSKIFINNNILKYLIKNNYLICTKKIKTYFFINKNNYGKIFFFEIEQWFIKIKKKISIFLLKKKINFINKNYNNLLNNWIKNITDWCISRQITWGVKIPIYFDIFKFIYLKKYCRYIFYKKNNEVLDTWFNSSIWSIYIYNKIKIKQDILVSGFDIVFYWIIKIIILNYYYLKKVIINNILLHGLIVDYLNIKISKTIKNQYSFLKIKNKIHKYKNFLIKCIYKNKIKINLIKKNIYIYILLSKLKSKNYVLLIKYYNFKFFQIKNFKKYIFTNLKNNFLNKNFFSKKIFLKALKLNFPIKNKILIKTWNYTINYYYKNKKKYNLLYIFKNKNKIYFSNKNYLEIFFKIKLIFYVKYKNNFF